MNNNIKKYRIAQNLTQAKLAEKSGVARTIIVQLENNSRKVITSETMSKIANALNANVEEIFLL